MAALLYWVMAIGGLVALAGGIVLLVFGDQLRARDEAAGRVNANTPSPQQQRRLAWIFVVIGLGAVLLAFVF